MKNIFLMLFLLSIVAVSHANEKLIFAIDLIRHGDRTPYVKIESHSTLWSEGLGQLTALGMRQEFLLGKKKRKEYVARYKLLDDFYKFNAVSVRSSNFSRTLMSAQSFLLGLFPLGSGPKVKGAFALPSGYQPVPIHTLPLDEDYLLLPDADKKTFDAMLEQYVYSTDEWNRKEFSFQPYFKKWSRIFHQHLTSIRQLLPIGDNLYVRHLKELPYPKGLSKEESQKIIALSKWEMVKEYQNHKIAVYTTTTLLRKIRHLLDDALSGKTLLKYQLFSAHDSTIMAFLSALKSPLNDIPPYASDVNILLFKSNKTYTIMVTYNDKPVALSACHHVHCTLKEFYSLVDIH
jgi:hypothetical protein